MLLWEAVPEKGQNEVGDEETIWGKYQTDQDSNQASEDGGCKGEGITMYKVLCRTVYLQ